MRALFAFVLLGCSGSAQPARVLFIGNSLTYVNDVPGMVRALSAAAGTPLVVESIAVPNASIGDHLDQGSARHRLESERWDFVVLQQGPSSRPESRRQFRDDAARLAPLIAAAGARAAAYMVWPIASEPERWDDVHDSYAIVARDLGGIFLPAGEAWRAAARLDPRIALYSPDGLHPTPAGSYAAALVISGGLTGRSPQGAPALAGLAPSVAATLQRAAAEALATPRKITPEP